MEKEGGERGRGGAAALRLTKVLANQPLLVKTQKTSPPTKWLPSAMTAAARTGLFLPPSPATRHLPSPRIVIPEPMSVAAGR